MKLLIVFLCVFTTLCAEPDQKVVLISGSSAGIGLATAKSFQEKGWKVWAGYRTNIPDELKNLENVRPVKIDVTDQTTIDNAVALLLREEGRLDALVNNAGCGLIAAEENVLIEEAEELFDINFFGCLRLIQAAAPIFRSQHSGHIINVSSTSGIRGIPGYGLYAASKFALEGLSESLAATLSPWKIQVSIVEPGAVNNGFIHHVKQGTRACSAPIYDRFIQALLARQIQLTEQGQNCAEIGSLIVSIAENPNPDMRYQTSAKVKETAAKKLVDLSGNALRDEQIRFFESMVNRLD